MPLTAPEETVDIHGFALREFRKLKGYKPNELATIVKCDRSYITKIELGSVRRVSVPLLNKIANALGLDDSRALLAVAPHRDAA